MKNKTFLKVKYNFKNKRPNKNKKGYFQKLKT